VEVIVSKQYGFYFLNKIMTLTACAVSAMPSKKICLMTLDSDQPSLTVQGTGSVAVNSCGLHVNSSSATAATTQGSATITSASTTVVGGYSGSGFTPVPQTGVPVVADPLNSLPAPVPPYNTSPYNVCKSTLGQTSSQSGTLNPGVYCGGILVKGNKCTNPVVLKSGIYVMLGGGLQVEANGCLRSESGGVFIYNTCLKLNTDTASNCPAQNAVLSLASMPTGCTSALCSTFVGFNFVSNSTVTLAAMSSDTYKNVLFFADRNAAGFQNTLNGSGSFYTDSIMYFPGQAVTLSGNGTLNGAVISKSMTLGGTGAFSVNYSAAVSGSVDVSSSRAFLQ
jgi:hypothetical protein